jgi:hypothetical protein
VVGELVAGLVGVLGVVFAKNATVTQAKKKTTEVACPTTVLGT